MALQGTENSASWLLSGGCSLKMQEQTIFDLMQLLPAVNFL
jgi:hypothetical protein